MASAFTCYTFWPSLTLRPPNVDTVIYGHSHRPKIETKKGTLFFTPGSAGPRRFGLPITVGRVTAEHGKLLAEIVELSVEHHRRRPGRA